MEKMQLVENRINELLKKLSSTERENERLVSQGQLTKEENTRAKKVVFENERFIKERTAVKKRIDDLLEKYREARI